MATKATKDNVRAQLWNAGKPFPNQAQFYKVIPHPITSNPAGKNYRVVLSDSWGGRHYISEALTLQGCADRINTFLDLD